MPYSVVAGKGGHPAETLIGIAIVGGIALKTKTPVRRRIAKGETASLRLVICKGGLLFVVFLPDFVLIATKYRPVVLCPRSGNGVVPAMAGTACLIAGLGKIGIIGIEHYVQITEGLPIGTNIYAAFVLDATAFTETGGKKGWLAR